MQKFLTLSLTFCFLVVHMLSAQPGKLISRSFLSFDTGTGVQVSGDSITVSYNGQLQTDGNRNYSYDQTTSLWTLKSRSTDYQYDANGNSLSFTLQTGNDIAGWVNAWRYSNTYSIDNHNLTSKIEKWGGTDWVLNSLTEYTYDANGLLLSSISANSQRLYTYTVEGLLETETYQVKSGGNWVNSSQETYEYFPNSSLVKTQTSSDWIAGAWSASIRERYQYDANGNNIETETDYLDQNQWTPVSRLTYEYDAENNLVYWVLANWDGASWEDSGRQFNTYDSNNNFTSARFEILESTGWQMFTFGRLHYGALSGINQAELTNFEIFPNPASSSVTLQGENLESAQILDRQGRVVSQVSLNQHEVTHVPVSQLAPGLYFIQVMDQTGGSGAKPLMIQR